MALRMTAHSFAQLLASPAGLDDLATDTGGALVITEWSPEIDLRVSPLLPQVVILAAEPQVATPPAAVDAVATGPMLDAVVEGADRNPQAATALAVLLRSSDRRGVGDGLVGESVTYAMLQAGPEFARWRSEVPIRANHYKPGPVLTVDRKVDVVRIEMNRPDVRNALNAQLRDELAESLRIALSDDALTVEVRGAGSCFCSGGDLDEFGTFEDPVSAHLIRLSRNLGWMLDRLADRIRFTVHGPCRGSGVELPAFAGQVTATADATFALPEVSMGLIPGAGGTVSLPRRIGRHRTLLLALSGIPIDAPTALQWGLIDEIDD